jgi:hypothetical protein
MSAPLYSVHFHRGLGEMSDLGLPPPDLLLLEQRPQTRRDEEEWSRREDSLAKAHVVGGSNNVDPVPGRERNPHLREEIQALAVPPRTAVLTLRVFIEWIRPEAGGDYRGYGCRRHKQLMPDRQWPCPTPIPVPQPFLVLAFGSLEEGSLFRSVEPHQEPPARTHKPHFVG